MLTTPATTQKASPHSSPVANAAHAVNAVIAAATGANVASAHPVPWKPRKLRQPQCPLILSTRHHWLLCPTWT